MQLFFRDADINDLPEIVSIYNSTVEGRLVTADTVPVSVESKVGWFNVHTPDRRPLWIVEDEQHGIIGWVSFQDFYGRPAYDSTAEISIYLHPGKRGKGLGNIILQHCFTKCKELNIHTLLGFIFAHNKPSIQLFLNLGFNEWANLEDIALMDNKPYSLKILGKKV